MGGKLTAKELLDALIYYPDTGMFVWSKNRSNVKSGQIAGRLNKGRVEIQINGSRYQAHRLAWLYMTGNWPCGDIDHIDGNASNNAFGNLRDVTHKVNLENQYKAQAHNSVSKYLGVSSYKHGGYRSRIKHHGKDIHLGVFETQEEARDAYLSAKRKLHTGCMI